MVSKAILTAAMIAYVEARFGQEQVPISAISAVQGGSPGAAATIAGGAVSDLLGAANACAKLATADKIVSELGGGADAIAAAIGMVTAEKNTNPFANGNVQNVCGDATLPATAELRGITPLIDPDVDTNGAAAALSAQTAANPVDATGKSVFDLMNDAGLGDLVQSQAAAGGAAATGATAGNANQNANANAGNNANAATGNNANAATGNNANAATGNKKKGNSGNNAANSGAASNTGSAAGNSTAAAGNNANGNKGNANANAGSNANANSGNANAATGNAASGNAASGSAASGSAASGSAASGSAASGSATSGSATSGSAATGGSGSALSGGEDFGQCTPTIFRAAGQNGRKATEFTFQITDTLARGGQQDALNPNIITNALCNQLTNVCGANDAAVTACQSAKQLVSDAGTRDQTTVDLFNGALGFAGAAAPATKRTITRRFRA